MFADLFVTSAAPLGAVFMMIVIFTIYYVYVQSSSSKSELPIPPMGSPTRWEVLRAKSTQKNLLRIEQVHTESLKISNLEFGSVFRLRAIPFLTTEQIVVTDFKLARLVLLGDSSQGIKESIKMKTFETMNLVDPQISNIFTARSEEPSREKARKFIAPAFSNINLQRIAPLLIDNIKEVFQLLDSSEKKNQPIEMGQVILDLIIGTLTKSSFEVDFNLSTHSHYTNSNSIDATSFLHELEVLVKERMLQLVIPFRKHIFWTSNITRAAAAQKQVVEVAQRVLDIYRQNHPSSSAVDSPGAASGVATAASPPPSSSSSSSSSSGTSEESQEHSQHQRMDYIIDRIVAHSYPSDKHRLGEILTFILAGHETSTNTLTFLLYELARNPDKQKKLQQELDEFITPESCPNGHPTLNQVTKMEYLNNCIRESMRLWPTATSVGRTTVQDLEYQGIVIPKGRFVQCSLYSMFRQPWIHDANEFIPERWVDETDLQQLQHLKEMFMPFAAGHRNCIGQNMAMVQLRLLSANFFKYFEFELVEEIKFEIALLMKPEKLMMRVRRRR